MSAPSPARPIVLVRPAASRERVAVRRLTSAAYDQYVTVLPSAVFAAYHADLMDDACDAARHVMLVASIDDEIVGAVRHYPDASTTGLGFPAGWAELRALAVDPAHRGRGVGEALVRACIDLACVAGVTLGLHTAEFMAAAVRTYERCGFLRAPDFDLGAEQVLGWDEPGAPAVIAYRWG